MLLAGSRRVCPAFGRQPSRRRRRADRGRLDTLSPHARPCSLAFRCSATARRDRGTEGRWLRMDRALSMLAMRRRDLAGNGRRRLLLIKHDGPEPGPRARFRLGVRGMLLRAGAAISGAWEASERRQVARRELPQLLPPIRCGRDAALSQREQGGEAGHTGVSAAAEAR